MKSPKELERLLVKIRKITGAGAQRQWDLGKLLLPIYNRELWTLLRDKQGNQLYKHFEFFVHGEISITYIQALRAMHTAERFARADLKGVTCGIANRVGNVRDPVVRRKLILSGRSLMYINQEVDAMPLSALFSTTGRTGHKTRPWSFNAVERLLEKAEGKLSIRVSKNSAGDATFSVAYAPRMGIPVIAQAGRLKHAVSEALRNVPLRTKVELHKLRKAA